jgi:hypothetical protein
MRGFLASLVARSEGAITGALRPKLPSRFEADRRPWHTGLTGPVAELELDVELPPDLDPVSTGPDLDAPLDPTGPTASYRTPPGSPSHEQEFRAPRGEPPTPPAKSGHASDERAPRVAAEAASDDRVRGPDHPATAAAPLSAERAGVIPDNRPRPERGPRVQARAPGPVVARKVAAAMTSLAPAPPGTSVDSAADDSQPPRPRPARLEHGEGHPGLTSRPALGHVDRPPSLFPPVSGEPKVLSPPTERRHPAPSPSEIGPQRSAKVARTGDMGTLPTVVSPQRLGHRDKHPGPFATRVRPAVATPEPRPGSAPARAFGTHEPGATTEPTIHVSIDRIEVRSVAPATAPAGRERIPSVSSLSDYLRSRGSAGGRQ